MKTFVTFSSPHLGYLYNENKIIDAGIWLIQKWRKAQSL